MDNNMRNGEIYDILLKSALMARYDKEADDFRRGTAKAAFSKAFEKRAAKIKRSISRKKRVKTGMKIFGGTVLAAAVFMGISFSVILIEPTVSAAVGVVIREVFDTHDSYYFEGAEAAGMQIDDSIRLGYIPEGYAIRTVEYGASAMSVVYRNSHDGREIYFDYQTAQSGRVSVDSEHRECTVISEKGTDYYLYRSSDEERQNTLLWSDGTYIYCITGYISREELLKMAEGIE